MIAGNLFTRDAASEIAHRHKPFTEDKRARPPPSEYSRNMIKRAREILLTFLLAHAIGSYVCATLSYLENRAALKHKKFAPVTLIPELMRTTFLTGSRDLSSWLFYLIPTAFIFYVICVKRMNGTRQSFHIKNIIAYVISSYVVAFELAPHALVIFAPFFALAALLSRALSSNGSGLPFPNLESWIIVAIAIGVRFKPEVANFISFQKPEPKSHGFEPIMPSHEGEKK